MDTKIGTGAGKTDPLADLRGRQVIVGAKQLKKALAAGRVNLVILAENADPNLTEPIEKMCLGNEIHCAWVSSMADLGRACGIDVGAAAAAVVK